MQSFGCYNKNGGKILKGAAGINIFTEVELDKITNNYDTLIGKGAFGMVFMGTTHDNKRVAVKRSTIKDKELCDTYNSQGGEDIVNEITFQFQNSHPNLVRLVGCCLETNIPVLVLNTSVTEASTASSMLRGKRYSGYLHT